MDKRECKNRLKDIVGSISSFIESVNKYKKVVNLENYSSKSMQDILVDRFETSKELMDILISIDHLRGDVSEYICGIKDSLNKDKWDEFYYNLVHIEDMIYVSENDIYSIDDYIKLLMGFKNKLKSLL